MINVNIRHHIFPPLFILPLSAQNIQMQFLISPRNCHLQIEPTFKMKKIKILIVEDEPLFATEMEMLVHGLGYQVVHVTDNSNEALYMANMMEPDLIIMDINIEGKYNGIEVAEKLKEKQIPILFVTSLKDEALYERAKKTSYVGYLIKPFDKLTLQSNIEFVLQKLLRNDMNQDNYEGWKEDLMVKNCLLIKTQTNLQKVPVEDIVYVQSHGNHCMIHTVENEKHLVNISLVRILKKLPEKAFIRIHKQYIIQLNMIENLSIGGNEVRLKNLSLPVGRTFKDRLISRFQVLG
ncbi:MAG TPA: response regulator transcription factor [Bacteroidetes bacterium]|nr:response regulator transcription factor [Bacteroidota bacterium]